MSVGDSASCPASCDESRVCSVVDCLHHQHPTSLMGSLNQLGITTRANRNAAMLNLAATVPAAVFASLIGISVSTATKWGRVAGGNWTSYAAIRGKVTASPRQNR